MALNATLDALAAKVADLQALQGGLDGLKPIAVTVDGHTLTVDPDTTPDAYMSGSDALRAVINRTVVSLKAQIADVAVAASLAPAQA